MAARTEARIAKNTSELTIQVEPKSRLNVTRLRVSSRRNATPRTKKCGLNRRNVVPLRCAPRAMSTSAHSSTTPSAMRYCGAIAGSLRYRNGQSSVAGCGVASVSLSMWSPGGAAPASAAMPGPSARVAAVLPSSG